MPIPPNSGALHVEILALDCWIRCDLVGHLPRAADSGLQTGDFVAVVGDSITEQKQYSVFIEDYLLMCQPARDLRIAQFGWGGETAPGFAGRMDNDLLPFKPTAATTCFGMNDGGYSPMTPDKAQHYRDAQREIVGGARRRACG